MSSTQRTILLLARLFFGLLGLATIGTQLGIQIQSGFSLVNFFSYFTNLSNSIAFVVFFLIVSWLITLLGNRRRQTTVRDALIR